MSNAVWIISLLLVAVSVTTSLAHLLEWPGKRRLDHESYRTVQTIYYPGFTIAGVLDILAILSVSVGAATANGGRGSGWAATSAALLAASQAIYWVWVHPINRVWLEDEPLGSTASRFFSVSPRSVVGAEQVWRDRWEAGHAARSGCAVGALLTLAVAAVVC